MPVYGIRDKGVSDFLKCWVKQGDIGVVGLIGPGTSRQLQSNWNSPFEQSSVGSMLDKTGSILQAKTDTTSQTTLNSTQIWEGNRPIVFNLNLIFYALSDAYSEVMYPLELLEYMASAEVKGVIPINVFSDQALGTIPGMVTLNFGTKMIIKDCVIESISIPLDKERDSMGNLIRAEVQMSIGTKTMINKSDIASTW